MLSKKQTHLEGGLFEYQVLNGKLIVGLHYTIFDTGGEDADYCIFTLNEQAIGTKSARPPRDT